MSSRCCLMPFRRFSCLVLLFGTIAAGTVGTVAIRAQDSTWTDLDGRTMQAEFVRLEGTDVVFRVNGREVPVPITRLSTEDRDRAVELAFSSGPARAETEPRNGSRTGTAGGTGRGVVTEPRASAGSGLSSSGPATIPNRRRVWTDVRGQQANARFIEMREHLVVLNRGGRHIHVPFEDLIRADQQFLRELLTSRGQEDQIPEVQETPQLAGNSPAARGPGGPSMYPGMPSAGMPSAGMPGMEMPGMGMPGMPYSSTPGMGTSPGGMPGGMSGPGGMAGSPHYPGMVDPAGMPGMMGMPEMHDPSYMPGMSDPPGMSEPPGMAGGGTGGWDHSSSASNWNEPIAMGAGHSTPDFSRGAPGSSLGSGAPAANPPRGPLGANLPTAPTLDPYPTAASEPRLEIDFEKAISLLLGQFFGIAIGSLIGAVILRVAAKWVEDMELPYGTAYVTMLLTGVANVVLGFSVGLGVALGTQSMDAVKMASIGVVPVSFLIQAGVISTMLEIDYGRAFLVMLAMVGIVLVICLVLFLPLGLLLLVAR